MMGPLGIAKASGDAARGGIGPLFYPGGGDQPPDRDHEPVPAAAARRRAPGDPGGEGVARHDFSMNVKAWLMNAGAMVLFLLIGLVLYSDLSKTSWLGKYLP